MVLFVVVCISDCARAIGACVVHAMRLCVCRCFQFAVLPERLQILLAFPIYPTAACCTTRALHFQRFFLVHRIETTTGAIHDENNSMTTLNEWQCFEVMHASVLDRRDANVAAMVE